VELPAAVCIHGLSGLRSRKRQGLLWRRRKSLTERPLPRVSIRRDRRLRGTKRRCGGTPGSWNLRNEDERAQSKLPCPSSEVTAGPRGSRIRLQPRGRAVPRPIRVRRCRTLADAVLPNGKTARMAGPVARVRSARGRPPSATYVRKIGDDVQARVDVAVEPHDHRRGARSDYVAAVGREQSARASRRPRLSVILGGGETRRHPRSQLIRDPARS